MLLDVKREHDRTVEIGFGFALVNFFIGDFLNVLQFVPATHPERIA